VTSRTTTMLRQFSTALAVSVKILPYVTPVSSLLEHQLLPSSHLPVYTATRHGPQYSYTTFLSVFAKFREGAQRLVLIVLSTHCITELVISVARLFV
jgi:hypothetical protein